MNPELLVLDEETENKSFLTERQSNILRKVLGILLIYFLTFLINFSFQLNTKLSLFYVNTEMIKEDKGNDDNSLRLALCTMGKKENLYAKEFVEYYIKIGFDHLFIYDDNDPNTEKIIDEVPDKYKDRVTIFDDLKNKNIRNQSDSFTHCYQSNLYKFDWLLMLDMDEFLFIRDDTIRHYLKSPVFDKCDFIKFHWGIALDNELVYYDNRTLMERFKSPFAQNMFIKTMVRGDIPDLLYWVHSPYYSPKRNVSCSNVGKPIPYKYVKIESVKPINVEKAFIIHYQYKSTEEFTEKIKRGYNNWLGEGLPGRIRLLIRDYFNQNKMTLEKINLIEKALKRSLLSYKIYYYFSKIFYFWFDF